METDNTSSTSGRKKIFVILVILLSAFLLYYGIMSLIGPARKQASLKSDLGLNQSQKGTEKDLILSDSTYLKLLKEKAFLQSRITMAESDSIYLAINLTDSTANIEISGVKVHTAKMSHVTTSKIFRNRDENLVLSLLASPFTIARDYATIRKEPVMIKMAPKDTSEYKPDIMPDTSITEPVNYILEMTDGTRIYIYQGENDKRSDRINVFLFDLMYRLADAWSSLKRVCVFKVPEYHPFIKMKLPRTDAKIIYRALPRYGQIAVYR
jgi:hypothetical protein